jgi:SIR2-like domain
MTTKGPLSRRLQPKAESVIIGHSWINERDLKGLRIGWEQGQLALFLGAGISLAYGIPSWKNLVLEMLFDQSEHAGRLKVLFPHYRRALAEWLADYFEYNPIILARMIEDDIRRRAKRKRNAARSDPFLSNLQYHLYADYEPIKSPTTLSAVAKLIAQDPSRIPAVVNFNFDDLLEAELSSLGVKFVPAVSDMRHEPGKLRIIHPHGFIPRKGDPGKKSIVFTERSYHALTDTVFHWALTEIVSLLRRHTVLFIGMSMSDPSLRRLLDASCNSKAPPHWQIQKRHEIFDHEQGEAKQDIQRRASKWGKLLKRSETKSPFDLAEIINSALRQADTYDRDLFEKMGVRTIWLNDFADIPLLLKEITNRSG